MKNKKQGNNWTAYYDPDTKRYTKNRSIWSICLGKAQLCIAPNVEKKNNDDALNSSGVR